MPILVAAVVLVGILSLANLLLNAGVIRRLRDQAEILNRGGGTALTIGMGQEVGDFRTRTVSGESVSTDDLVQGDTLVAFFSPTCRPCQEKLPAFVDFARTMPGGRERVLAAVVGDRELGQEMAEQLGAVARVVREESNEGPLSAAFQLKGFPAVLVVAAGRATGRPIVTADRVDLSVPVPTPVPAG